jgi:hypothetical protein
MSVPGIESPGSGLSAIINSSPAVVAPASSSRKIPMICSSVNRLGFKSIPRR